ncbi:MAG: hypothetical protein HOW73_26500, partial [Polyangiaceae bacterium]|nr:hypothetical protein [Polyangiaceae bacterium]
MSKLLNARDLLELVRQGQVEDAGEAETVTANTLGRKVYRGTTGRRPARRNPTPAPQQQPRRGPRNTQLIEAARGAPAPREATPPAVAKPPAPVAAKPPTPPIPPDWSARPPDPVANREPSLRDPSGRRTTVQMPRPGAAQQQQQQPKPPIEREEPYERDDARTLELRVPALRAPEKEEAPAAKPAGGGAAPVQRPPEAKPVATQSPPRSLSPVPGTARKVSMGVWGRAAEGAPATPPATEPAGAPATQP